MKKKVLIIVHGVFPKRFHNRMAENFRSIFLGMLTSERGIKRKDYHKLADYLRNDYDAVELLPWDGKTNRHRDLEPAIKRLVKLLKKYRNWQISIIAVSLGGLIAQEALIQAPEVSVKHLVYIGAVHNGRHKLKNARKTFNIYSKIDKMFFFANDVYEGMGNAFLKGEKVINLLLPNIRHGDLCRDLDLDKEFSKEKSLFGFYRRILNGNLPFVSKAISGPK